MKTNFLNYLALVLIILAIQSCRQNNPQRQNSSQSVETSSSDKSIETNNHWFGHYTLSIDYGKLDEFSEMFIGYDVLISQDSCVFSGMGYQTYFTYLCKIEEQGEELRLFYIKSIEGYSFTDHPNENLLATLIKDNNQYYIKSPIIADKNWEYNKKLLLTKEK